ncbi:MAG: hypothetical protein IJB09_03980 [Oscillospiraceae bacterium]|nr:hypothetical protein [Oscillospiraceae bacterium]
MVTFFLIDLFNALGVGLFAILLPYAAGRLVFPHEERDKGLMFIVGMCVSLAVFEIIYLPFFFLRLPFKLLTIVYFVLAAAALTAGFLLHYRKKPLAAPEKQPLTRSEKICAGVFALVFVFQVLRVTAGAGTWNIDDAWYLTIANDALHTNTIMGTDPVTGLPHDYTQDVAANMEYIFSPWPMFWAMFAQLFQLPVTTLMRTVLPFYFIAIFYFVLYRLVLFIFSGKRDKALMALCLLSIFYEFSAVAMNVRYTWIILYPWMGKGFGPSVICTAALFIFLICVNEENAARRRVLWPALFMANLAGCMCASSCAELNLIALGCWGLVCVFDKKDLSIIWKLAVCVSPSLALMAAHFV